MERNLVSPKNVAIFDVCGTLVEANTTYDFYSYYFKKYNRKKYLFLLILMSIPLKVVWKAMSLVGKGKQVRTFLVSLIRGESVSQVKSMALEYAAFTVERKKIPFSIDEFNKHKDLGSRLILLSASIDPVVSGMGAYLGVALVASTELETFEGKYTGGIRHEMEGQKVVYFNDFKSQEGIDKSYFFTDNKEDFSLLKAVDFPCAVSLKKDIPFWEEKLKELPTLKIQLK